MMHHFTADQFFCECGYSYADHGPEGQCLFAPGHSYKELKGCGAWMERTWGITRCIRGLLTSNHLYELYHCGCLYGTLRHIAHYPKSSALGSTLRKKWDDYARKEDQHGAYV